MCQRLFLTNGNFETNFIKKENLFQKLEYLFLVESIKIEKAYFHTKLSCQKPMLRQIELGVRDEPITKNGVLPVTLPVL